MRTINKMMFDKILKEENRRLVFVMFTQNECDKTEEIRPKLAEYAKSPEFKNVSFNQVIVENDASLFRLYKVKHTPTFIFFLKGEEVCRVEGAEKEELNSKLHEFCPKDFVGQARKIQPSGSSEDYLDKILQQKPVLIPEEGGAKPKPKPKKKSSAPPSPIAQPASAFDQKAYDNLFDNLILLGTFEEDLIKKVLDYAGTNITIQEAEELCKKAQNGQLNLSSHQTKTFHYDPEKVDLTAGLTNEQKEIAQQLIEMSFAEVDSYAVVKLSTDFEDCINYLGEWQEIKDRIGSRHPEAGKAFEMLIPVFGFQNAAELMEKAPTPDNAFAKEQIKQHFLAKEKEMERKRRAEEEVRNAITNKPRYLKTFTELSAEDEETEKWYEQQRIKEAKKMKEEREKELRMKAEIAAKIREQRTHVIPDENKDHIAKIAAPSPSKSNQRKCKVQLYYQNKPETFIMALSQTMDELLTQFANKINVPVDSKFVISDPTTKAVFEFERSNSFETLGITGLVRYNIEISE